jgi:hypothetical protein
MYYKNQIYISFFGQCEYDIFPLYYDWQNWQRTFCEHWNEDKKGNINEEKILQRMLLNKANRTLHPTIYIG